jgi:hypothetical protein
MLATASASLNEIPTLKLALRQQRDRQHSSIGKRERALLFAHNGYQPGDVELSKLRNAHAATEAELIALDQREAFLRQQVGALHAEQQACEREREGLLRARLNAVHTAKREENIDAARKALAQSMVSSSIVAGSLNPHGTPPGMFADNELNRNGELTHLVSEVFTQTCDAINAEIIAASKGRLG